MYINTSNFFSTTACINANLSETDRSASDNRDSTLLVSGLLSRFKPTIVSYKEGDHEIGCIFITSLSASITNIISKNVDYGRCKLKNDLEFKRHLFRLAQELLNNAKKHSQAANLKFGLSVQRDSIYFEYMDDGVGFELARQVTREIGSSGIGMEQMKSRILALGGRYELHSARGEGMKLLAKLPLKEVG